MRTTNDISTAQRLTSGVFLAVAILLVAAVETGINRELGVGERLVFWLLFLVGIAMCARGPLAKGDYYGWGNPRHLLGYLLGGVALVLSAAILQGFPLPLISSDGSFVLALGVVMGIKVAIARLYPPAA